MDLYVNEYGAKINLRSGVLCISKNGNMLKEIPINTVDSLVIHSSVQITSQAVIGLSNNNCPISWINGVDKLICSTCCDNVGHVLRKKHQYRLMDNMKFRIGISRKIIVSKLLSQLEVLKIAEAPLEVLNKFENTILNSCLQCKRQKSIASLRGLEGNCAALYFQEIKALVPPNLTFDSRTRQPPKDEFNAILSFLYSLLYNETLRNIQAKGLDPYVGVMHEIKNGHYALASDIMEEFRYICDLTALDLALSADKENDFSKENGGVYLSGNGRAKAIEAYETSMKGICPYMNSEGYGKTVRDCLKRQSDMIANAIDSENIRCYKALREENSYVRHCF
ncbi:MAG: CRISPR-associated endonuclease Cas1 [Oscillospiraceae bacterium]